MSVLACHSSHPSALDRRLLPPFAHLPSRAYSPRSHPPHPAPHARPKLALLRVVFATKRTDHLPALAVPVPDLHLVLSRPRRARERNRARALAEPERLAWRRRDRPCARDLLSVDLVACGPDDSDDGLLARVKLGVSRARVAGGVVGEDAVALAVGFEPASGRVGTERPGQRTRTCASNSDQLRLDESGKEARLLSGRDPPPASSITLRNLA